MHNRQILQKQFRGLCRSRKIHEAVLLVENSSGNFSENFGYGGKTLDTPINSASVGKLFTTAGILLLQEKNLLSLDNLVVDYFDKDLFHGLHNYQGVDYSHKLKLADLLFQTSGLANYEEEGGITQRVIKEDFTISTGELLEITKTLKPRFAPLGKKAYYSDLNFHLLGEIIEKVSQNSLEKFFHQYIFHPLGLTNTFVPINEDFVPPVFYKNQSLSRPKLIKSLRGGGNAITSTRELMIFLKAFFFGKLFSQKKFGELANYRKLQITMGPLNYGGGYMQIPLNTIFTLFMGKGELLGHSGSTGSFAFYYPHKDLFFTGDTNQMASPGIPISFVMKLALSLKLFEEKDFRDPLIIPSP